MIGDVGGAAKTKGRYKTRVWTMSGIDDLMADPDDRWARATRRAQGIEDNGLSQAVRLYYTSFFPAGFFILVAVGTVGGTLVFPDTPEKWATSLALGLLLGVLGALIGGLVYNAKKVVPAAKLGRIDVLISLEREEQKHVRRQILGKAPTDQERLAVTKAAAVQLRKGLATQLIVQPVFPLIFIPQALNFILRGDSLFAWLMAVAVGVTAAGVALVARDFRRAGQFLTRTAII